MELDTVRIVKAIKYINQHKAKMLFRKYRDIVERDLHKPIGVPIHGTSFQFVREIQRRFPNGFYQNEYIIILQRMNTDFTKKQKQYFSKI